MTPSTLPIRSNNSLNIFFQLIYHLIEEKKKNISFILNSTLLLTLLHVIINLSS